MICKIGKSLAEIENFIKEKYIQEMVLYSSSHNLSNDILFIRFGSKSQSITVCPRSIPFLVTIRMSNLCANSEVNNILTYQP